MHGVRKAIILRKQARFQPGVFSGLDRVLRAEAINKIARHDALRAYLSATGREFRRTEGAPSEGAIVVGNGAILSRHRDGNQHHKDL